MKQKKQIYQLNSRPPMGSSGLTLVMTLTLNFQCQIWNLLYLGQKLSDCHEMKNKHIDWTLGLKWGHQFWLWPWPWPWIFNVKYGICYISAKNDPIAPKQNLDSDWMLGGKSAVAVLSNDEQCEPDVIHSDLVTSDIGVPSTHLGVGHIGIFQVIIHV